jgi:CDP-glucose 4,6-dehydratase
MTDKSPLNQKKILLTGFNGLLGSWLVEELLKKNCDVIGIAKDNTKNKILLNQNLIAEINQNYFNISNYENLSNLFSDLKIDLVIHLAAQTQVTKALLDPLETFETNIKGTWNILELCRLNNIPIVFASSDKAYGDSDTLPYKETHPLVGKFPYEVSKSSGDLIASTYKNTYNLDVITLRCGNIFGGRDLNWDRLIPGVIKSLINNEIPTLRSNGEFIRDWVYVNDVVNAYIKTSEALLTDTNKYSEYNFSSGSVKTVSEIYTIICEIVNGQYVEPIYDIKSDKEIKNQYLDTTKIEDDLGIKSIYSVEKSLELTVDWYRQYFNKSE